MATMTAPKITGRTPESRSQNFDPNDESGHILRNAATALGQGAEDACSTFANKADEAAAAAGRRIESVADQVRSRTSNEGVVGMASEKLATSLESGGKYLEAQGVTGMVDDITALVRNNPITSLLVGVGLGFMLARASSRH